MTLLLMAAALAATSHTETLSWREKAIDLHYTAHIEVQTRAAGAHAPTRSMERSCHWQAKLIIERQTEAALSRPHRLPVTKRADGVLHGPCHQDSPQVLRAAAKALGDLNTPLREAARHDSAALLAEWDASHARATQ